MEHCVWLRRNTQKLLFRLFVKPGSTLFRPKLHKILVGEAKLIDNYCHSDCFIYICFLLSKVG